METTDQVKEQNSQLRGFIGYIEGQPISVLTTMAKIRITEIHAINDEILKRSNIEKKTIVG